MIVFESGRKAHEVFDKPRRQHRMPVPAGLGGMRSQAAEEVLPASDRWLVVRPVDLDAGRRAGAGWARWTTAEGSIRSPLEPRCRGQPFVPSVARGVGNRRTRSGNDGPPLWVRRVQFLASEAVGVGSSRTAIDSGIPIPLPLIPRAWWRA
jgi:hypothetical protein